ncbi:MAG TPA: hypothetical protein EYP47_00475 [Methanococcaceae archaeon]|uniref:DegT/DnrJ/EryC1/StrS aminotransferase n=1 Tax=Methanothermococcus okinawensis TaxID=155863 RepID=A0A832ZSP5_9EURY|nr:hypothetical protein [Methanococcaceae archaeon]HIP91718.1 hypothetical protein [Methanothermococcus okinawensis]
MILPYRRPSLRGMLEPRGDLKELTTVIDHLLRSKMDISILPSGNAGLYIASYILRGVEKKRCNNILVPDMGGWRGFLEYPKMFKFNTLKLRTNLGVVDPAILEDVLRKNNIYALFLTTLAGYLVRQPMEEIKKVCEDMDVVLVEDASGGVGGACGYGDIVICSTGTPKIINCEYGGFIGISKKIGDCLQDSRKTGELKSLLKAFKVMNIYGLMKEEALSARRTYKTLVRYCHILKEELENAYFKGEEGVCVFVEHENPEKVSKKVNEVIKLDNRKSLVTRCPIYERVLKKGIVIEMKKVDIHSISREELYEVIDILKRIL